MKSLNLQIDTTHSFAEKVHTYCEEILAGKSQVYLFGINELSLAIAKKIEFVGYIDQFTSEKSYEGKPIVQSLDQISASEALVISCIIGRPWTVKQKLDDWGGKHLDYFSFLRFSGLDIVDPRSWNGFRENFQLQAYENLFHQLEDLASKLVLQNLINFRLSLDLHHLKFNADRQFHQYLEPFLHLSNEVFIDVGGFDGNTTRQFQNYSGSKSQVYFFEPDSKNMKIAQEKLAAFPNKIEYFPLGLGHQKQTLYFNENGSRSNISNSGNIQIDVERLDDLRLDEEHIRQNGAFMKMDIEGWEMNALMGASEFIKKHQPKLAICVYHKEQDLIDIPAFILSLVPNYKIYLRHYTEGIDETVMYFTK